MSIRRYLISGLCVALAVAPAVASAGDFNDEAAAAWVARTNAITHVEQLMEQGLDGKHEFGVACQGLTGDLVKYGQNTPMWAQQAHSTFCSGVNIMSLSAPRACKVFKQSRTQLTKADAAKDPADVVKAAQDMHDLLDVMIHGKKDHDQC